MHLPRPLAALGALSLAVSLAACGSPTDDAGSTDAPTTESTGTAADDAEETDSETTDSDESAAAIEGCTPDSMDTLTAGTFTIGTDKPAYPPWFIDDEPANGEGYESAVAYAIAERLGFGEDAVEWVVVPFNTAIAPGAKNFDIDINQVSITEERRSAVDFSTGYYDVRQTVVTVGGSPIADATSIADLKDAKLGAQVGTTSYNAATEQIAPTQQVSVFDTNDVAVQALQNGQIDGLVVDLPTAFYMTAAQLDDGVIVGQLPETGDSAEQFGAVLDLGSPLTECVSKAVDSLREDGTLDSLVDEWLSSEGAPELS